MMGSVLFFMVYLMFFAFSCILLNSIEFGWIFILDKDYGNEMLL